MKKIIILGLALLALTGCNKRPKDAIKYQAIESDGIMEKTTFEFTGKSKNFSFSTGKVFYSGTDRQLIITNFKLLNKIKNIDKLTLTIDFDGKEYRKVEYQKNEKDELEASEFLNAISITDYSKTTDKPITPFIESKKSTFKKQIEIKVEYCVLEKCKNETMEIAYY